MRPPSTPSPLENPHSSLIACEVWRRWDEVERSYPPEECLGGLSVAQFTKRLLPSRDLNPLGFDRLAREVARALAWCERRRWISSSVVNGKRRYRRVEAH